MNSLTPQIGIDVSAKELVVSIDKAKPFALGNSKEEILQLCQKLPARGQVHLEASGGYERQARRILEAAGFTVTLHNPGKVRQLARATSAGAKTDPVDARHLSSSGHLLPAPSLKSTDREALCDHSRAITQIKETIAEYKKRLIRTELDRIVSDSFHAIITSLCVHLKELEQSFEQRVLSSQVASDYRLAQTIDGIGPATARICICEFPEDFRERGPGQIAAYAGLAPIDHSSGKMNAPKRLSRGNARLKAALYMPAITVISTQSWAKNLYANLRAKGKAHQSAIVAVMRRLLIRVHAVLKRGTPWKEAPPNP